MSENKGFKTIEESLKQINFSEQPIFIGQFDKAVTIDNPSAKEEKDKTFIVFRFFEFETGEAVYVPSNFTIEKAINSLIADKVSFKDTVIRIEFLGKSEVKGKPFSKFKIQYMNITDYISMIEEKESDKEIEENKTANKKKK